MPHETVFCTKVHNNWADCEYVSQLVSPAVQLSPKDYEVVVGVTLETHHLVQETSFDRVQQPLNNVALERVVAPNAFRFPLAARSRTR